MSSNAPLEEETKLKVRSRKGESVQEKPSKVATSPKPMRRKNATEMLSEQFNLLNNDSFVTALQELRKVKQHLDRSADSALKQVQVAKLELKKLLVTIVFEIFSGYLMSLMGVIAAFRMPMGQEPLPDLGFEAFTYLPMPHINNHWMTLIILLTIIRVIYHPSRVMIFRRILIVHSFICVIRSICIVATSLPDPSPECRHFVPKHSMFVEALYRFVTFGFDVCGDVFFSGHFAMCVEMAMVWEQYTKRRLYKNLIWLMVIIEACFLLSTRFHYTIDIIIGGYLGFRMWNTYHTFSPFFSWIESAPAVLRLNEQESNETFEVWLSRIPTIRNTVWTTV